MYTIRMRTLVRRALLARKPSSATDENVHVRKVEYEDQYQETLRRTDESSK